MKWSLLDSTTQPEDCFISCSFSIFHVFLRNCLESDLDFLCHRLTKDFRNCMSHFVKLSKAFQFVENGKQKEEGNPGKVKIENRRRNNRIYEHDNNKSKPPLRTRKEIPSYPYGPHNERGLRPFLRDCRDCPEYERKVVLKKLTERN